MQSTQTLSLEQEIVDGTPYEFFPLGHHIVMAPDVCAGEPTFKYTRINVRVILNMLRAGYSVDELVAEYDSPFMTQEAVREAMGDHFDSCRSSHIA